MRNDCFRFPSLPGAIRNDRPVPPGRGTRALLLLLGLSFVLPAVVRAGDGPYERMKPGALLVAGVKNTQKREGYHVRIQVAAQAENLDTEGVVKGKILHVETPIEVFAREAKVVAKDPDTGKYVSPENLPQEDAVRAGFLHHPDTYLNQAAKQAQKARWRPETPEELIGEIACKVVVVDGDSKAKKALLDALLEANPMAKQFSSSMVDAKNSTLTYTIWVGTGDGLVYRVLVDLEASVKMPGGAGMGGGGMTVRIQRTYDLDRYDEEIDFEIPREVAAKLR